MTKSIAILTPVFPPYRGGIGKVAELDARQLAGLGFDVHVYAPFRRRPETSGLPYAAHRLAAFGRYGNAAFVPGAAFLSGKYDAVLLHYPFFGGAEPLALARKISPQGKLLLAYHMDVIGSGPLRPIFSGHTRHLMPAIVRSADRILVTSGDYASTGALASLYASGPDRFRELPPSVDAARFSPGPKPPELLARFGFNEADRSAVFVGGLDRAHYFKGIPVFLRALSVRDAVHVKAVIVGEGGLRPEYERLAEKLGLDGRVRFAGGVGDAELPDFYRLGDVFIFPSVDRSEAFGIAALEAAAAGLTVIASDLPGVRTIVRARETGLLVPPGSASALAAALSDILRDDGLRRKLGENARAMVVREYADEARVGRWRKILEELELR